MKKVITLLMAFVLCFAVVGCGGGGGEPQAPADEPEVEESAYPIILTDTDLVKFEITEYDAIWEEYSYTVENKTDKDLNFSVDKVVANEEYTVDTWIYSDMGAGTKASDTFFLDSTVMDNFEDGETVSLEFTYSLIDNNTFETVADGVFVMEIIK